LSGAKTRLYGLLISDEESFYNIDDQITSISIEPGVEVEVTIADA
jgi:hypothetical protein